MRTALYPFGVMCDAATTDCSSSAVRLTTSKILGCTWATVCLYRLAVLWVGVSEARNESYGGCRRWNRGSDQWGLNPSNIRPCWHARSPETLRACATTFVPFASDQFVARKHDFPAKTDAGCTSTTFVAKLSVRRPIKARSPSCLDDGPNRARWIERNVHLASLAVVAAIDDETETKQEEGMGRPMLPKRMALSARTE